MMTVAVVGGIYSSGKPWSWNEESCAPTLIILWHLSFRWRISRKYHFLRPIDVLSTRLCQLCRHICVLKHKSWGICWRTLSTLSPDVLFFSPPPYNQTLLSPLLPVSIISTLHLEGLIKHIQMWNWVVHTARSWIELVYYGTVQLGYIITQPFRLVLCIVAMHLITNLGNDQLDTQLLYFTIGLLWYSTCFEHYMLIIRRLNFIDAASGIVTLSKWCPVHRLRENCSKLVEYHSKRIVK